MKIAMLGHKRSPSSEGGVEIVVGELSARMAALGHDVTLYNRSGKHISEKEFGPIQNNRYKGVRLKTVFTINKKGLAAMTASLFGAICAALGKYDVVHFHAEGPCAMIPIVKLSGKKVAATIHGLDWQRAKWSGFAAKYLKFGEKMAAKYADEIIVLSENLKKYFKNTYNRETVYIPNGVEKLQTRAADKISEKWGLKKDSYILFLGRIVPEKGLTYLIDAFHEVKTDKKLVIAGGSSDTDEFVSELYKRAGDNVIFTGFVQGEYLRELYSNAYVYTLPSDLEGMPISLLEAMSYGNCCLVSDIPECSEVVEDKAVLFEKSNIDDLAKKLQWLCDNPQEVEKYRAAAAEYICGKFNWDEVADRTLELYEGLL